jgi:penicillin amidase
MPLLANDPHLGISIPGVWYPGGPALPGLCRPSSARFEVSGFSFAGLPGVVIGHNAAHRVGRDQPGPRTSPTSTSSDVDGEGET